MAQKMRCSVRTKKGSWDYESGCVGERQVRRERPSPTSDILRTSSWSLGFNPTRPERLVVEGSTGHQAPKGRCPLCSVWLHGRVHIFLYAYVWLCSSMVQGR